MGNALTDILRIVFSAGAWHADCRRPACRRARRCVPPRDADRQNLFACPFEPFDDWYARGEAAEKIAARLASAIDARRAREGKPPRFAAPPAPGPHAHLDLSQPLDPVALLHRPEKPVPLPSDLVCR